MPINWGTCGKHRTKTPGEHDDHSSFPTLDVVTQPTQPNPKKAVLNFPEKEEGEQALAELGPVLPVEAPQESRGVNPGK